MREKLLYISKALYQVFMLLIKQPLHIVYFLSYFYPRNKDKWVFSSWEGKSCRGNCLYLYEYLSKNSNIDLVWITKNKELFNNLKNSKIKVKYSYSFEGIYALLSAKVVFISHSINDVIPYLVRGSLIVNLGHATYPIKNMSFSKHFAKFNYLRRMKNYIFSPYNHIKPSYELVSSKSTLDAASLLDSEKDNQRNRIISLGLPKCDYILSLSKLPKELLNQGINQYSNKPNNKDSTIILFLPTWRKDISFNLFDYGFDIARLDDMLEAHNATMIINFHPFDESIRRLGTRKLTGRIRYASYNGDEVVRCLCASDILITDYSSLYSDYLLLDRPIIFSKFDYDKYINEREINVDYESLPGVKVSNWGELCDSLEGLLTRKIDKHKKSRNRWKRHIYSSHDDGKSCERIHSFINTIL